MADWIWKEPPIPERPELPSEPHTSAFASDQVYFESAFRPEWIAQFAALSNDDANDANGNLSKEGSAGPSATSNTYVVAFDDAVSDGLSEIAPWLSSWIAGHLMVPDPFGNGSGTLQGGSLDNAATDGQPDGAQFGHTTDGNIWNAQVATSPVVGSSTSPSIIMDASNPLGLHDGSLFGIADGGSQA